MTSLSQRSVVPATSLSMGARLRQRQGGLAVLMAGLLAVFGLFVLTALDVAGQAVWWEIGNWTLTAVIAVGLAAIGARASDGPVRQVRLLGTAAMATYLTGQLLWDGQVAAGLYPVPAPSDLLFLGMAFPFAVMSVRSDRNLLGFEAGLPRVNQRTPKKMSPLANSRRGSAVAQPG